ncbi:hypothetical protein M426DRAFT_133287 [Hypoxylon sp. CI-4A]|nr:hypothetical protein M426DRAFT_133287 [Hypoxylon sp. CI-4A]
MYTDRHHEIVTGLHMRIILASAPWFTSRVHHLLLVVVAVAEAECFSRVSACLLNCPLCCLVTWGGWGNSSWFGCTGMNFACHFTKQRPKEGRKLEWLTDTGQLKRNHPAMR